MHLFCINLAHVSDSVPIRYKKGILILCLFCAYFVLQKCAYFVLFCSMGHHSRSSSMRLPRAYHHAQGAALIVLPRAVDLLWQDWVLALSAAMVLALVVAIAVTPDGTVAHALSIAANITEDIGPARFLLGVIVHNIGITAPVYTAGISFDLILADLAVPALRLWILGSPTHVQAKRLFLLLRCSCQQGSTMYNRICRLWFDRF